MFKKYAPVGILISSIMVAFVFQNCGQTPKSMDGSELLTSSETGARFDKDCLQSNAYDACIFFKNPTNTLTGVQNAFTLENLDQQQIYGVPLPQLLDSQYLKDNQIDMITMEGTTVQRANVRMPASAAGDGFAVLLSTQSYYWAREVLNYFTTAQTDLLAGFQLNIVAQAPVLGWSPNIKTIFLSSEPVNLRKNSALDSSIVTHLTTEAVIHFLTQGKIYDLTGDTHHKDCGTNSGVYLKNDCCQTKNGCSKAISAGISDYINAVLFPSSPMLGDYLSGDPEGSKTCNLSRNLTKHKTLTFQQAYDSCSTSGRSGQFYDMGVALSATLQAISSQLSTTDKKEFLQVLTQTIKQLKGSDNFIKFRDLLLAEAASSNSLTTLIQSEFSKRL